jgi:hypothetical protein
MPQRIETGNGWFTLAKGWTREIGDVTGCGVRRFAFPYDAECGQQILSTLSKELLSE